MKGKKSILIVDLQTQIGIALVRSFGKNGLRVYGICKRKNAMFFSKYLTKGYIFPSFDDEKKLMDFVDQIIKRHDIDYVISYFEKSIVLLNRYRDRFEKNSKLLISQTDFLDYALDKHKTLQLAEQLGIPTPKTVLITNNKDLYACKDFSFPVVVKPSSRTYKNPNQAKMDFRREYFRSYSNLLKFFEAFDPCRFSPVLVQEYCNGEEIGFPVLMNKGKCVACMQYKTLRTYPVNGGTPIYRETTAIDPQLKEDSIKLLKAMNLDGVAEIDYIKDGKDGKIKLLEVNGRFWGSTALSMKSGIDFPYLLYQYA